MSQRTEPDDSLDDFPTPPWATRALLELFVRSADDTCLEPACGRGHMAKVLLEYFKSVTASDVHNYGFGGVRNYLAPSNYEPHDWIITNPPFKRAEEFILRSLNIARVGIAILARSVFTESVGRYENLFSWKPPTTVAQFVERVPMVKGRLDPTATTATSYAWFIWHMETIGDTKLVWIPPCRKRLERPLDYLEQWFKPEGESDDASCPSGP